MEKKRDEMYERRVAKDLLYIGIISIVVAILTLCSTLLLP